MANWGALTDHWGFAGAELEVVDSSGEPRAQSADVTENGSGDEVDTTYYGNTAGGIKDASVTYLVKAAFDLATLYLGEVVAGKVITSVAVNTAPKAGTKITVAGQLGCEAIEAPTGKTNQYPLPAIDLTAGHFVQPLLFTVTAGEIQSATATFTAAISEEADGLGEPVSHGVSGAAGTLSAEFAMPSGTAAWTLGSFWVATKAKGATEPQNSAHRTTLTAGSAAGAIPRGTVPE